MRTIWKYKLDVTSEQTITMPEGARILCAGDGLPPVYSIEELKARHGQTVPFIWAEVDSASRPVERRILIAGTSGPLATDIAEYVGSAFCGAFVWHVYDAGEIADVDPSVPPRLWRSMCRSGAVHAEFAIAERANVRARCQEVVDFDNQAGCGPHRVEYSDDDGQVWRPEGTATP